MKISEDNYLICPCCDRYTKVKVIPGETIMKRFPLYCQKCKKTFLIDYE